ncbi:leucine-rich repeat domain-containing protein [Saprospira sp. CCB-QB6]|uniref:leucine-rich repeat domain-containing protein n=1 Tax=Saprospira sp. CCB-QB6 TaxID=3023936 RepID=UPI00234BFFDE|nr:leucine-rich repeat domain-containing protein [Saprospira sp. CCB-QB6]WCL81836.1 leucine-rich repeat domain-containing protein [Saprospira sp. CCB-QB6]
MNILGALRALIGSADMANIELAFSLAEGQSVPLRELLAPYYMLWPRAEPPAEMSKEDLWALLQRPFLNLSNRKLVELPKEIGQFRALEQLDLSGNQLETLPQELGELPYLHSINLNTNRLEAFPSFLGALPHLQQLFLGVNKIKTLPKRAEGFRALRNLQLFDNELEEVSFSFFQAEDFGMLNLSRNPLRELSLFADGQFGQLRKLELSGTQLRQLPADIGLLYSLTHLDLSYNPKLEELPASFERLDRLQILESRNTPLKKLDQWLQRMPWVDFLV